MKKLKYFLLPLGFIPYFLSLPYMYRAWKYSPMDRWDWIFPALFLVVFTWVICFRRSSEEPATTWRSYFFLLPLLASIGVMGGGLLFSIHAAYILGSLLFAWSGCWFVFGKDLAVALLPAFFILALSCTSSTYWLGFFLGIQGWQALCCKLFLAAATAFFSALKIKIRLEGWGFFLLLTISLVLWWNSNALSQTFAPVVPDFFNGEIPAGYVGRELPATEESKRFFQNSRIHYYNFADDARSYHVLAVRCGKDIHEIHPASHCLRSSGVKILSEAQTQYLIHGEKVFLSEIVVQGRYASRLYVVWYSNQQYSVGSFLKFRSRWNHKTAWFTYQISTELHDDFPAARQGIEKLLNSTAIYVGN